MVSIPTNMLAIVVSFLLLPAIFNAEEVGGEDHGVGIQASVRLLEDQLQQLYEEKAVNPAISGYEAELSNLYNSLGEEEEADRQLGCSRKMKRICKRRGCRSAGYCSRCLYCQRLG